MPGQVLSDADVFGAAAPAAGPQVLSDADVFGQAPAAPQARSPRSDASIAWGGAKAGIRSAARSVADFGDMLLSVPGMAVGTAADVASRVQSIFEGVPHPAASRIAKDVRESMTEKFSPSILRTMTEFAIKTISPDKKALEPSDVQKGMQTISQGLEKGGKWVEEKTKGAINAEDFDSLVNEVMALGGLRGAQGGAKGVGERLAERADRKAPPPEQPPETPTQAAAKRDVKADIEAATGVDQRASTKARDQRRAQARAAFKEDPQYADYLRNYAEEEAKVREQQGPLPAPGAVTGARTPRTGLKEGQILLDHEVFGEPAKIETGEKGALDRALGKTAKGQQFDLTADELAALKKAGSQYGRPTILDSKGKPISGKADPASLAALAAFVGGATAMQAWSDNPSLVKDAVAGLMAAAATSVRPKSLLRLAKEASVAKPLESIGAAGRARADNLQLASLDIANTVKKIGTLVPQEARRAAVHEALDRGSPKGLAPKEVEAFNLLKGEYSRLLVAGREAGVLKDALSDYATHILKADRSLIDRLLGAQTTYGTSPHTPYELERKFRTIAQGEAAGFKYVKDAAFVYATYARSIASAAENARLLETVKAQRTAGGDKLLTKADEAPPSYVRIDNPQLRGMAVHPEVAPQMKFIFENPSSAGIPAALEIIADVSKRSAVSASLFHTKALIDSLVGSLPLTPKAALRAAAGAVGGYALATTFGDDHAMREAALAGMIGYAFPQLGYIVGRGKFLEELRKGSSSELVGRATKAGLTFGTEKGPLVVDDAGRRFYDAMKAVQTLADKITQPVGIKGGKGVEAYIKANHAMDEALWGRLHPGMKLEVWSKTSEILRESSIARNAKNPKSRILSQAEADSIAANFANDQFGGLNWTKIAMESQTRLGRIVAQSLLSPKGRQALRIAMFAPDWTISTARAALAAVDKDLVNPLKWGNVARGMFEPMTRGDLARQYIARSALYYLVVGDAINYSMSGHHLWENKDWSFIDWGDGRRMQFSKHVMEVPHWFDKPVKQGLGKLGYVPKEAMNQAFGTEYLAPREGKQGQVFAGPRMTSGRLEHAARGFEPIPFQSAGDPETFLWGFAGMPLYGMTEEQKREAKRKREETKRNAK